MTNAACFRQHCVRVATVFYAEGEGDAFGTSLPRHETNAASFRETCVFVARMFYVLPERRYSFFTSLDIVNTTCFHSKAFYALQ